MADDVELADVERAWASLTKAEAGVRAAREIYSTMHQRYWTQMLGYRHGQRLMWTPPQHYGREGRSKREVIFERFTDDSSTMPPEKPPLLVIRHLRLDGYPTLKTTIAGAYEMDPVQPENANEQDPTGTDAGSERTRNGRTYAVPATEPDRGD